MTATSRWPFAAAAMVVQLASGCSESHSPPAPRPEGGPLCPATPEETIGAPCAFQGLVCGPQYTCGALAVTLRCLCNRGFFACSDLAGNELTVPPMCPGPMPPQSCSAGESSTRLAACFEPGFLCTYASSCPGRFDSCECSAGTTADGGFGLRFECRTGTCSPSDGGIVAFDAASDASVGGEAGADSANRLDSSADGADGQGGGDGPDPATADAPPG